MLEVRTPQRSRYIRPWQVVYIEPSGEEWSTVYLPRRDTRYYSMDVHEPAYELAERVAQAMSGTFPSGSRAIPTRTPWVFKAPKPTKGLEATVK